jgi:hypothetical protein
MMLELSPWRVKVEEQSGRFERSVWRSADMEVRSAKTEVCGGKKYNLISINEPYYKAPEKSYASEELFGYCHLLALGYRLQKSVVRVKGNFI